MILKQSTAATVVVGPVLDSAGAAVTTALTANFSLSKNGTVNALTSETVTHSTNGYYTIALTSSNTDTLGRVEIIVNDSAMSMATHRYNVVSAASYDLIVSSGSLSATERANIAEAAANLDILTTPFSANTWGRVARDTYTGLTTVDVIVNAILADTADMQPKVATAAEIADAVYDEPYAGHTTAGTYGFLWDKWRKSNPTIAGEVTAAVTPTTTTFSTDITGYADTAFDNAVLVFINGSTNADFRGVVSGYLQANGQVTITPALPQAPVAGDEFVIAITSFVYTLAQTQSGLATSAGVTAAFTEIKGATWDSGTDTLEAIRNASGGGSSITITAGAANAPARSDDTNLIAFVDETISQALAIYEADGTTAKDMSGKTLTVVFENLETTDTAVVAGGDITVSGANNNTVTWAYPSAVTANVGTYRYALRDAAAPKTVYAQGLLFVKVAAAVD